VLESYLKYLKIFSKTLSSRCDEHDLHAEKGSIALPFLPPSARNPSKWRRP